jgi:hypothetical protein
MKLYFNNTELTEEAITMAHNEFIKINQGCIKEAETGTSPVNDLPSYIISCNNSIKSHVERTFKSENNFTFLQRAYYFQTGKSVALLS